MLSTTEILMFYVVGLVGANSRRAWPPSGRETEPSCSVSSRREEVIIKTKESLAAGAVFISSPNVDNDDECLTACCDSKSCNTAVVKFKDNTYGCFLFDCGTPNVCTFSSHVGYMMYRLTTEHVDEHIAPVDTHASDLANLASLSSLSASSSLSWITTPTVPTEPTSTTATTTTPDVAPISDDQLLYGACRTSDNCAINDYLECLRGYCVCQPGYHPVGSVCRADCSRFQFECVNSDDASLSECIAVYDRCNGIAQCRDGSDENSCGSMVAHPVNQDTSQQSPVSLSESNVAAEQPDSESSQHIVPLSDTVRDHGDVDNNDATSHDETDSYVTGWQLPRQHHAAASKSDGDSVSAKPVDSLQQQPPIDGSKDSLQSHDSTQYEGPLSESANSDNSDATLQRSRLLLSGMVDDSRPPSADARRGHRPLTSGRVGNTDHSKGHDDNRQGLASETQSDVRVVNTDNGQSAAASAQRTKTVSQSSIVAGPSRHRPGSSISSHLDAVESVSDRHSASRQQGHIHNSDQQSDEQSQDGDQRPDVSRSDTRPDVSYSDDTAVDTHTSHRRPVAAAKSAVKFNVPQQYTSEHHHPMASADEVQSSDQYENSVPGVVAKPSRTRGSQQVVVARPRQQYAGSRYNGPIVDQGRYMSSNGRMVYGEPVYPSADYYYGSDVGRPVAYDSSGPVDYDYYNILPVEAVQPMRVQSVHRNHAATSTVSVTPVPLSSASADVTSTITSSVQQDTDTLSAVTMTTVAVVVPTSPKRPNKLKRPTHPPVRLKSADGKKLAAHIAGATMNVDRRRQRQDHIDLSARQSEVFWATPGVGGAIVVLTIGIIVTTLTLTYVACRYRRQRKLSRRRPHSNGSNDADYLVNGMYL